MCKLVSESQHKSPKPLVFFDVSNAIRQYDFIFRSKDTEKIWDGIRVAKLQMEIQAIGRRKLRMINNSVNIQHLTKPPSNKLEKRKAI